MEFYEDYFVPVMTTHHILQVEEVMSIISRPDFGTADLYVRNDRNDYLLPPVQGSMQADPQASSGTSTVGQ